MPTLPPKGHYPACILPLYVLARALQETFPVEGEVKFDLTPYNEGVYAPPSAAVTYKGERRSFGLAVCGFSLSRDGVEMDIELRPKPRPGPAPQPRPLPGQPVPAQPVPAPPDAPQPPEPEEAAVPAVVTLVPPYDTCLLSESLSPTARWRGFIGIPRSAFAGRSFPDDGHFSFPRVAKELGRVLREALAAGAARADLLEDEGDRTPVPPRFWLTEAAEAVLASDVETSVKVPGRRAVGHVWFDGVALEAAWAAIWDTTAVLMEPSKDLRTRRGTSAPIPRPTPWMVFMQQIAQELGYSGGFPHGQYDLTGEDIGYYIQHRLKEMDPQENYLGEVSRDYARAMGAFISHPSRRSAGKPPTKIGDQREAFRKKFNLDRFKQDK